MTTFEITGRAYCNGMNKPPQKHTERIEADTERDALAWLDISPVEWLSGARVREVPPVKAGE